MYNNTVIIFANNGACDAPCDRRYILIRLILKEIYIYGSRRYNFRPSFGTRSFVTLTYSFVASAYYHSRSSHHHDPARSYPYHWSDPVTRNCFRDFILHRILRRPLRLHLILRKANLYIANGTHNDTAPYSERCRFLLFL